MVWNGTVSPPTPPLTENVVLCAYSGIPNASVGHHKHCHHCAHRSSDTINKRVYFRLGQPAAVMNSETLHFIKT